MSPTYHCTPPRRCADTVRPFDSPMLTPSPLRQPTIFSPKFNNDAQDIDDLFRNSPYRSPAQAHIFQNPAYSTKPLPIQADDEEGRIFLSSNSNSPRLSSPTSQPIFTPLKSPYNTAGRVALADRNLNEPQPIATSSNGPMLTSRAGIGTKRKVTPQCTPLKIEASGSFQKLGPLPAPKFATKTPHSKAEAEEFLRKQTATLTKLKLSDRDNRMDTSNDSDCDFDEEAGANLFRTASKGKEKEEVVEAVSPGGRVVKRRARTRPLSAELRNQQPFESPSPVKKPFLSKTRPRHSGTIAFPSSNAYRSRASPSGSSSSEAGSPAPRRRISNVASRPYIKPPVFAPRPPISRQDNLSAATLFFGPVIPQSAPLQSPARTRTTTSTGIPNPDIKSARSKAPNRHSYGGTGTSGDWAHIAHPSSPSPMYGVPPAAQRDNSYISTDEDEEMSFEGPAQSSFTFSLTGSTPSPSSKKPLPRKFESIKRRSLGDYEMSVSRPYGGSLAVMPGASTSSSSLGSDDGLITPLTTAPTNWPGPQVHDKDSDDHRPRFTDDEAEVDEFIVRTLAAATKGPAPGSKRPPGTPVKKVRTAFLGPDRPWQSAVASKIGIKEDVAPLRTRKIPRQSMPAVMPMGGKSLLDQCTDTEDEEDSPSAKKDSRYTKLGLGHPVGLFGGSGPFANPRTRWLMRRSSSGAFSSGSETTSQANTPTRTKGIDWQLPKLAANLSPSGTFSKLTERSASGSSTSSGVASSPTNRKGGSTRGTDVKPPRVSLVNRRLSEPSLTEQSGRFERDFVTVDEVGSGEFGSVIKVRSKGGDENKVYAIKRSKRFEGAKHRLRLWEEVEVLKHLSESAELCGLDGRHPNVLAYIDSWEEDEALFIQTELCESGNLAHFLWEYGKVFPRLDEARVWKCVVDLSNGLRFIHESGVIHLDLKPSNVFVTHEGRFKIGDFGMASLWPRMAIVEADGSETTSSFEREGDKLYLAPEVLQGRYSKAADVFSFGMTILETATNIVVPDQGESWHRLRREDFSEVDWEGSNELLTLIQDMMRTDPAERIDVQEVYNHCVVARAREKMEMTYAEAKANGSTVFAASPLASVPRGFLEEILGRDSSAMDESL
ncbi:other/WEE protein kinase [Coprinopsis cinerea okayama7|uniref:Other/WEE protein kinase n=1 Tax=Coprinopsis cinerea (strain Okayama-7 / 130 / ATCC MYA-4618 / FGSC 9003) TaxID=240176 RepID=A8N641_COPC7|nr:other/WEE protein kinase [Coprinopsis cinerea okayama7\|eukprot:XP_001830325.2 other/WEE protein kinase [Coprinopsis cinerea okayama7\